MTPSFKKVFFIFLFSVFFYATAVFADTYGFHAQDISGDEGSSWGTVSADIDGDGDTDIFTASFDGNKLWLNDGSGNFTEYPIPGIGGGAGADIADIDGDGDMDIIAGYIGGDNLKLWLNDGSLHFTQQTLDTGSDSSYSPVAADIDGDGDLDIYAPNRQGGSAHPNRLFINDGSLHFTEEHIVGDTAASLDVNIADIDGDGDLDIYTPSYGASQNKLWLNDGLGNGAASFTASDIAGDTSASYGAEIADIDNDGDIDIVTTAGWGNAKLWMNDGLGNGGNSFHEETLEGDVDSSVDVELKDFNNDGKLDIFISYWGIESKLWINDGKGNGGNSFHKEFSTDDTSDKVCTTSADFNGDGLVDVYETVYGDQNKLWFNVYKASRKESSRKQRVRYVCRNKKAENYSPFGRHKESLCIFKEKEEDSSMTNPFGGALCPQNLLMHNFMKEGDRDGTYSSYNKGKVNEVALLQKHINRILKEDYQGKAAGPEDGIFGKLTKRGVERLQKKLNMLLKGILEKPLVIDGIVGPFTRNAINHSCSKEA